MKNRLLLTICLLFSAVLCWSQAPTANFTSDVTGGCSPIVVNFTDQSSGAPTSWLWDFGNGATSTRQNPSTTYFAPGTYTVTLTATNAAGSNTVTKTAYITVFNQPTANFIADKTLACSPAVIQFTDQSITPPGTNVVSWLWNFGDGGSSTLQNPQYVYRNPGSYTVTLTITNDKGCTKLITKPNYIDVTTGVVPSFNYADPGVCSAPATINYNNTSTGPGTLTYFWDLGNGTTATTLNAGTTYTTNGTYRVSLVVSSSVGCIDSSVQNVVVGRVNTDFTVPPTICPKTTVQFINTSVPRPISSVWQFSNGTSDNLINGQTSFATPGTYTVRLINRYTVCTDTLTKTITVAPGPTIDFRASDTAKCTVPQTINFTNLSNGTSYKWYFGDGDSSTATNPSHTYTAFGDYTVTLIAIGTNGCVDTLVKPAYIKIRQPNITFPNLPARGCVPYTHNFSANIVTADTVLTYLWDFGDGSPTSSLATPTHVYSVPGTYNITLTITTSSGCTKTVSVGAGIRVGTKPVASFTAAPTTACASAGIQFTNTSPPPTDQYFWSFGDGSTSTLQNPLHIYNDTGFLDIKFVVSNNGCDSDTTIKLKHVYIRPPVSKFNYQPDCNAPLIYTFTDASIAPETWEWNFGDGTTFTGQNPPPHTFPGLGTYNVSLTTTNGSCTYTTTRTVVIADNTPDFSAPVREGCKPFTATFTAVSPNASLMTKYLWDFGDGVTFDGDTSKKAQFTYTNSGNFYVRLSTVDSFGCNHTVIKNPYIRVNGPLANFGSPAGSGCKGLNVTFADSTLTDGVNGIVKWEWNFGDGTTQTFTAPPFSHVYDTIGNFDVSLTVTDAKGCTHKITKREFVKISKINAKWSTPGQTCPNSPIGFSNESLSDLPFTSFWDFGDTQTSVVTSPSHAYTDTGFYTVKLVITDLLGCADSLTKINAVHVSLPKADFTANNFVTYCTPFEAKFTNTSGFYNSSFWDLSIATSTQQHPSIYYSATGTYPIKLVVTSPGGCMDSVTKELVVKNPNDGNLTYAPLNGCSPLTVDLSAFSEMNARFIWDFGDGNVSDTSINALTHIYRDFGDFTPKVILIEPGNTCVVPITGSEVINVLGVKAKYALDTMFYCDSGRVSVLDSTTTNNPALRYNWDFGDGTTYSSINPSHYYSTPGLYNVKLTVTTAAGCIDSLTKGPVRIIQSPLISVETDTIICVNDRILHLGIMDRPDTSVVRWVWTFPNGNSSNLQNPAIQQYTQAGTFQLKAIATNSSGCADTVTKSLLVNPLPFATLPPVLTKVVGVSLLLPGSYSSNAMNWVWTPNTDLSCTNCPQPNTTTRFNTKYTVVVEDSNTCKNSAEVQVIVTCPGTTVFLPNTFSPNGDGTNDVFYARGTGLDRVKSLRIFNRWGQVVFEQTNFPVNNPSFGWNGTYKGAKALPDVYIYQVEVFCENSEIIRFEGNIALIK